MDFHQMIPLLLFACFMIAVYIIMKIQLPRIFPEKYKDLKQKFPSPIKTLECVDGRFKGIFIIPISGIMKIDVYPEMLIVSLEGRAILVRYDKNMISGEWGTIRNYLLIENIPILSGKSIGKTVKLKVWLYAKDVQFILDLTRNSLVRKA